MAYGNIPRTIYTLFQTILGGVSWHEVCDPLFEINWIIPFLFLIYVAFTILAMLNVVTGIFVDNAFHFAQNQRNIAILKEIDRKDDYQKKIIQFFDAVDEDGSGEISVEEFTAVLEDPTLAAYFRVLEFDIDDARRFIDLIDTDKSGSLSVDEFLKGCQRFKGPAQAIDVHAVLQEVRSIKEELLHSNVYDSDKGQRNSFKRDSSVSEPDVSADLHQGPRQALKV